MAPTEVRATSNTTVQVDIPTIADHHLVMLAASGITTEHAAARGYETITDIKRLADIKVVTPGRRVPGLLVPQLRADGTVWGYQYRPDNPRVRNGRPVKYESPYQQRNGLDVPPGMADMLGDPNVPLWITEGVKKADCGALHGLCIVALSGVWNWLTTSTSGGKMALPDFRDLALNNGRIVILAFDGDVARNPAVLKALHGLANYLAYRGAKILYLHLPDAPEGKVGLDDFLMSGHTVSDLRELVKPTQPVPQQNSVSTPAPALRPPPPPFGSIDGAALLDEVDSYLGCYVVHPNAVGRQTHTLWVAHTHLMECWESTPRLGFLSPEPASGKTRALEVTEPLVPRPVHAVNTTPAYLFRKVSDPAGLPTILYDEIDTVFGPRAKDNEEIRGMLNAGHRKGAVAGRCAVRGKVIETEELPAYCGVVLAGLNDLPDTIMTRTIVERMKKRAPSEKVKPWRMRIDGPKGRVLGKRLAEWADSVRDRTKDYWPEMPEGLDDRNADKWEPLLAVADMAGGHWPKTARVAAVAAVADSKAGTPSLGVQLLHDIRSIFSKHNSVALVASVITSNLKEIEESPWSSIKRDGSGIDARELAKRLNPYGIGSRNARDGFDAVRKHYFPKDFADAWDRYLPAETPETPGGEPPDLSATTATDPFVAAPLAVADNGHGQAPISGHAHHCACGEDLSAPVSIARGYCEECRLTKGNAP
jgi:Protein of unknown function (DUF3631)/Domain of unknown function (DUF3854)